MLNTNGKSMIEKEPAGGVTWIDTDRVMNWDGKRKAGIHAASLPVCITIPYLSSFFLACMDVQRRQSGDKDKTGYIRMQLCLSDGDGKMRKDKVLCLSMYKNGRERINTDLKTRIKEDKEGQGEKDRQ